MPPLSADSGPASFFPSASDRPASSSTSTVGTTNSSTTIARSSSSNGNPSGEISKGLLAGSPHDGQSPDSNGSSRPGHDRDRDRDRVEDHGLLEDQRVKKRRTGPSSRGVANLTPEQLAKKRANDREAQRAIRERTKNQIENLERRIRELTSQQPYQELQAAIRAKEAVEAENAEIKNRLASIMSLIQPILSNQQAEGAFTSSPFPNFTPTQTTTTQRSPSAPTTYNASTPVSAASPASIADSSWQQSQGQQSQQPSPSFTQVQLLSQQRHELSHNLDLGAGEQLKLDFLLDPSQRVHRMQTGSNGAQDTLDYQHLPMKHDWSAVAVHPSTATSTPISPSQDCVAVNGGGGGPGPQPQQQQQQRIEYAVATTPQEEDMLLLQQNPAAGASWVGTSAPIRNGPPTCPLDSLLLDFLHERRQRAAEGVPPREVVGPRYPSVRSLLNPAHSAYSHPLSKVFTDILAAFPGISGLPERVAVLYYMFLVMRWQVRPTRDNYDLLPPFAVPTPAQLAHPHPAWIDHLPFPRMRDVLAREYYNPTTTTTTTTTKSESESEFLFDNFFIPFTTTVSLNWPYEPTDALLQSPDGAELLINPVFERHMRRLENWTLGSAFDEAFPRLRGTYNLKREEERGERTGSRGSARNGDGNGTGGRNGDCVDGHFSGG